MFRLDWMMFFVKSAADHFEYRNVIRRTWASVGYIGDKKFFTVFILGKSKNSNLQEVLVQENLLYNDILQCDSVDSYQNLTLKVKLENDCKM